MDSIIKRQKMFYKQLRIVKKKVKFMTESEVMLYLISTKE